MNIKDLYLQRDKVFRYIDKQKKFRISYIQCAKVVKSAAERHKLNEIGTFFLGKVLMASTLIASMLKGEERVTIDVKSNGVFSQLYAEANKVGEVRGFVVENKNFDVSVSSMIDFLGTGTISVSKMLYGKFEPMIGITELKNTTIEQEIVHYLQTSEQIDSALVSDIHFDSTKDDRPLLSATGLLIEMLPNSDQTEKFILETQLVTLKPLHSYEINTKNPLEDLSKLLEMELEPIEDIPIDFYCRCSLDKFKSQLITLGKEQILEMRDSQQNELICHYCNEHYYLSTDDFSTLLDYFIVQNN